ncbi:MAG: glutamine amidotransferase, partial [Planctomycetota bacterium]|nr:glutamine amidotransferase [Planctomycetota bacterium]
DHRGVIAVGLDVSKSMSLSTGANMASRFERAREAVLKQDGLLAALSTAGEVRLFAFGNNTRQVQRDELAAMVAGDDSTHLAAALKEIPQSVRGLPLDALVLLTDGVDTSAADPVAMARYASSRGATVHAVGFGERSDAVDVKIMAVRAPRRAQLGALVEIVALVHRGGVKDPLSLRLYQDMVLLKTEPVPPSPSGEPVTVRLSFIPEKEGTARLLLEIPPAAGEKVLDNNKHNLQLEVEEKRVEVLFIEGSPRHEYAFIRRAMWDNRHFRVVTLLRLGKGRFYHKGDDDSVLSKGFPDKAAELGRFKAIILSDIESSFFTAEQMKLIADFVRVRGGGLLMLGGVNSFNLGGYRGTPVADILPVPLEPDRVAAGFDDSEFYFQVTKDGAEHEILKLIADPVENASQWALMPALRGFNPLFGAKPGARVLAVHPGPNVPASATAPKNDTEWRGRPILLAVQDAGAGRTAAFAPANSWRWKMLRKADDDSFRRFWAQMIRWLAVGSKEFLSVSTDVAVSGVRQPVTITAQVLDKAHRPSNAAKVVARVKDPFGNVEELPLPWVLSEDGVYQAVCRPAEKGEYSIAVSADLAGTKLENTASFMAIDSPAEFARPAMDAATLERIAAAGNGTVALDGATDKAREAILAAAQKRRAVLDLVDEHDLRDAPILLLAIAGVWIVEWILRKRSGLA